MVAGTGGHKVWTGGHRLRGLHGLGGQHVPALGWDEVRGRGGDLRGVTGSSCCVSSEPHHLLRPLEEA